MKAFRISKGYTQKDGFRPQQGLTIMNQYQMTTDYVDETCFRPQQGLTIMNHMDMQSVGECSLSNLFPSPTGVNYYESLPTKS